MMLIGYIFNSKSVAGGNPFRIYQMTGNSMGGYASLSEAGISQLEQFPEMSEAEVLQLHGMRPSAMGLIRQALADNG